MRHYLLLHLVVLAWGLTAILGKLIHIPAPDLVIWRTGIAAIGFAVLALISRVSLRVPRVEGLKLLGVGCIIGWHWVLFFLSARLATASICLAAMPTIMIWSSLIEPLTSGSRHWSKIELLAGLVIVGAVWMIYEVELRYWLGFSVGLVAALMATFFVLTNKHLSQRHHHITLCFYQMLGACISCAIGLPFISDHAVAQMPAASDWPSLLVLALVCTVAAYAAYIHILRRLSVFTTNLVYNMEPVYGILLAALVFGDKEKMHGGFYLGASIIIATVIAVPFWQRRTRK